jgi:hypothetical protein
MMASTVPYDLIKAKIETTVGLTYPIIEWDSVAEMLTQMDQNFIALEDTFSSDDVVSVGSPDANYFEEEGEIDIHVFIKAVDGFNVARVMAGEIQAAMRMQYLSAEVRVFNVGPPNSGLIADGIWSSMIVGLTYRYNYTAPTFV